MSYDYSELLGEIVKKYRNQKEFAPNLGISERTLSLKLNGKLEWKQSEMEKAMKLLGKDVNEISLYFFSQ